MRSTSVSSLASGLSFLLLYALSASPRWRLFFGLLGLALWSSVVGSLFITVLVRVVCYTAGVVMICPVYFAFSVMPYFSYFCLGRPVLSGTVRVVFLAFLHWRDCSNWYCGCMILPCS